MSFVNWVLTAFLEIAFVRFQDKIYPEWSKAKVWARWHQAHTSVCAQMSCSAPVLCPVLCNAPVLRPWAGKEPHLPPHTQRRLLPYSWSLLPSLLHASWIRYFCLSGRQITREVRLGGFHSYTGGKMVLFLNLLTIAVIILFIWLNHWTLVLCKPTPSEAVTPAPPTPPGCLSCWSSNMNTSPTPGPAG